MTFATDPGATASRRFQPFARPLSNLRSPLSRHSDGASEWRSVDNLKQTFAADARRIRTSRNGSNAMRTKANITAAVFAAYLKCPTKAYLTVHGETPPNTFIANAGRRISAAYKASASQGLGAQLAGVVPIDFLQIGRAHV